MELAYGVVLGSAAGAAVLAGVWAQRCGAVAEGLMPCGIWSLPLPQLRTEDSWRWGCAQRRRLKFTRAGVLLNDRP